MTRSMKSRQQPEASADTCLDLYRTMTRIRHFDDQVGILYKGGLAPGLVHLYSGQEAVAAGVCAALRPDDWIASHHRGHGHCIAKGGRLDRLFAEIMARRPGYGLGRGGSMHIHDPETRNLGTTGIVGGGIALAAGAALTAKRAGNGDVAVAFFGDGALNQGILFETLNIAAIWALPVLFVCENNGYGEFTETDAVTAGHPYSKRADAFDIPVVRADGMDALTVHGATAEAVGRARDGGGPSFLLFDTYRFTGHHVGDKGEYRDADSDRAWRERDPIARLAEHIEKRGLATGYALKAIAGEARSAVASALEKARAMPPADPADLESHLWAET
jgi:pyruvate dehydrogenase E1 component alpha subunit